MNKIWEGSHPLLVLLINLQKQLIFYFTYCIISSVAQRGVAKFGIALGSGPRGHGFKSRHSDQQKTHFCLPTKVRFLNDVCLRQMMWASPNDERCANDVCLWAHRGKHRIIAKRSGATSYLRSKYIISP